MGVSFDAFNFVHVLNYCIVTMRANGIIIFTKRIILYFFSIWHLKTEAG